MPIPAQADSHASVGPESLRHGRISQLLFWGVKFSERCAKDSWRKVWGGTWVRYEARIASTCESNRPQRLSLVPHGCLWAFVGSSSTTKVTEVHLRQIKTHYDRGSRLQAPWSPNQAILTLYHGQDKTVCELLAEDCAKNAHRKPEGLFRAWG